MIVGLTGGIGSGKTIVARLFAIMGAKVFNSDECAKQLYVEPAIKERVIGLLGTECYLNDDTINKKYISQRIFSNTNLLKELNAIIHPAVAEKFKEFVKKYPNQLIIKESALLIETGLYKELDELILVTSPLELRIKRVMQRDGVSEGEVRNRIKSQLSEDEKLKLAGHVIQNNECDFLITQVLSIYKILQHA
jgi:dephospho-CoA kinase